MTNKQAIFVTMIVICGIALIFVGIGRERLRVERGTCANRECISQIQGAEEAAEDLPKGAQNIDYFVWVHELLVEMEFQLSEEQFVQWAGTLGWDRNEVVPNKGDGSIILSGLGTEKGGHLVEIDQSYS